MFDPDDTPESDAKVDAFKSLLQGLEDCDLRGWDQEFIGDLIDRSEKIGYLAVSSALTSSQLIQLERIKETYFYEETSKTSFLD